MAFSSTAFVSLLLAMCVYGTFGNAVREDFVESLVLKAKLIDENEIGIMTYLVSLGEVMVVVAVSTTIPPGIRS